MGHEEDYTESQLRFLRFAKQGFQQALEDLSDDIEENPDILNVGVGPGGNLDLFAEFFDEAELTAVDISQPHLDRAEEEAPNDLDVNFRQMDVNQGIELDQVYDLVWASDLLNPDSIEDPVEVLEELKEYTKEDGKIALYFNDWLRPTFLPGYPQLESNILSEMPVGFEGDWQGYSNHENAVQWLEDAGFSNIDIEFYQVNIEEPNSQAMDYPKQVVEQGLYQDAIERLDERGELNNNELELWKQLSDSDNESYIFEQEGYYASMPSILFKGEK